MDDKLLEHIKPGEFTFCSRCGHIVRYGKQNFMCSKCNSDLFPAKNITALKRAEICLDQQFERQISDLIEQHREQVAQLRSIA